MTKLIKLVDYDSSNQTWTVEDMLKACLENQDLLQDFSKAVIIFLDDKDGAYETHMQSARMFRPDLIALLGVARLKLERTLADDDEW